MMIGRRWLDRARHPRTDLVAQRRCAPGADAKTTIEETLVAIGQVLVSAISTWELAMLVQRGGVALAMDMDEWLRTVEHRRRFHRADHSADRYPVGKLAR